MRRVFEALMPTYTRGTRLLQFEGHPGLREEWFDDVLISVNGRSGAIDPAATGLADNSYHWICSSHLVSSGPEDRAVLAEMLRVAGDGGVVALSLRGSASSFERVTSLRSASDLEEVHERFGPGFLDDLHKQFSDVCLLELITEDPCTASVDGVYFCSRDEPLLHAIGRAATRKGIFVRFFAPSDARGVAVQLSDAAASGADWDRLKDEIRAWQASGHRTRFWVRDDDAYRHTDNLLQLLELCRRSDVPISLAVIPQRAGQDLVDLIGDREDVTVLQHGFDHKNRSSTKQSSEFPDERALEEATASIHSGWSLLTDKFGRQVIPVFVPPWGTCSKAVRELLPSMGFTGYSASQIGPFRPLEFCRRGGPRSGDGLFQASAHVAVNRATSDAVSELPTARVVTFLANLIRSIRSDREDPNEPIGIMTHAWGVDASVRAFLQELFYVTRGAGAEWISAREVFAADPTT
jgi:hypothetical protein